VRKAITAGWGKAFNLFVLTNDELRKESGKLIDQTFQVTYAMEIVAVLLALLGVVNTLLAAVIDRTREIGLLRAVGANRAQVVKTLAAEAGCMGLVGAVIGTAAGAALAGVLLTAVGLQGTGWAIPLVFPYATAVQMAAAAIFCGMLAGLYPARRAAGLDVVEALAYE
jgi:putative ABC transport system permease protein